MIELYIVHHASAAEGDYKRHCRESGVPLAITASGGAGRH